MTFTQWITGIIVLFAIAVLHQTSLGKVTANLDQAVTCKIIVYRLYVDQDGNEGMTSSLENIRGWATEVLDNEYFTVDFTNDMSKKSLPERWNNYVQDRHANDCGLSELPLSSGTGTGGMEARFKGDSEDF